MRHQSIYKIRNMSFSPLSLPIVAATLLAIIGMASQAFATAGDGRFVQFEPNIPGVIDEMLDPSFWIARVAEPDKIIMTPQEIRRYNHRSARECKPLEDLRYYRRILNGDAVRGMISAVSSRPSKKKFMNGSELTGAYFDRLERALDLAAIPSRVMVRYGITVRRTEMRTFPTFDRVFNEPDDYEFDRFIETALYPVEPLVILHTSADGEWFFAQAYNYLAWVPVKDVALTDSRTLFDYLDTPNFLVVTGKRVFTGYNPIKADVSELLLDMGVRIPLASRDEIPLEIYGQHPVGNYVAKLPVRGPEGNLEWGLGLISRTDEVHLGYLPFTPRNIITQAFKFLGQRYGWGGMFNARDCSAFIMDNFRTMGVMLPRNAGEQGKLALGAMHHMPESMSLEDRKKLFDTLPPAVPIYMDGHAMLYLCKYNNDYYIIHDFAGYSAPDETGEFRRSKTRGVSVTPLLATFLSKGKHYMQGLYSAREFRLDR
ncbi:MAG TPA: SH3 domain-containing protein [Candidatus Ozemobacteraceae bacterium]|nr:SH3 domain-containing protein [Candidatus Ozemobacteraceae bacterium]